MLYEIRPFMVVNDARGSAGTMVMRYSRIFKAPVFGVDFGSQRYNVYLYDDNEEVASFEIYLGDANPTNLILAQSGNYGDEENNISRSFVLFEELKDNSSPDFTTGDMTNEAASSSHGGMYLLVVAMGMLQHI